MYHTIKLGFHPMHIAHLAKGGHILVNPRMHGHGTHVRVTSSQMKRMGKSRHSGRSIKFKMSKAQFRHNMKHGGSVFSSIGNALKSVGKKALGYVARRALPYAKGAVNSGINAIGAKYNIPSFLTSGANYGANSLLDYGASRLGAGRHRRHKRRRHAGSFMAAGRCGSPGGSSERVRESQQEGEHLVVNQVST